MAASAFIAICVCTNNVPKILTIAIFDTSPELISGTTRNVHLPQLSAFKFKMVKIRTISYGSWLGYFRKSAFSFKIKTLLKLRFCVYKYRGDTISIYFGRIRIVIERVPPYERVHIFKLKIRPARSRCYNFFRLSVRNSEHAKNKRASAYNHM